MFKYCAYERRDHQSVYLIATFLEEPSAVAWRSNCYFDLFEYVAWPNASSKNSSVLEGDKSNSETISYSQSYYQLFASNGDGFIWPKYSREGRKTSNKHYHFIMIFLKTTSIRVIVPELPVTPSVGIFKVIIFWKLKMSHGSFGVKSKEFIKIDRNLENLYQVILKFLFYYRF